MLLSICALDVCPTTGILHQRPDLLPWGGQHSKAAWEDKLELLTSPQGTLPAYDTDLNTSLTQKLGSYTREVKWWPGENFKFCRDF